MMLTLPCPRRPLTPVQFRLLAELVVFGLALTLQMSVGGSQCSARPLTILVELSVTPRLFLLTFLLCGIECGLFSLGAVLRLPFLDPCHQNVPLPVWAPDTANKSADSIFNFAEAVAAISELDGRQIFCLFLFFLFF